MVTELVFNASPLIGLGKGGLLGLLEADAFRVKIPLAVAEEVLAHPQDPSAAWLSGLGRNRVVPNVQVDPVLLAWDLGAGETSVIAQGVATVSGVVVLDDLAARRCAQAMGLRCTGTLGFLLMAKRRKLLPAVMPAVTRLREAGIYLGEGLIHAVRTAAEE